MKVTPLQVTVCILAMCLVEETRCKAIIKRPNNKVPLEKTQSPEVDVIQSKPKILSTPKMEPSGHEMDVDDRRDMLIHDRKELQESREPCGKGGVACRRRKKRQIGSSQLHNGKFSKLLDSQLRSKHGINRVYDLQSVDNVSVENSTPSDSVFEDDDDDEDDNEDGHFLILRQRRESDVTSDDSDKVSMSDDNGDDKLSYSEHPGLYVYRGGDIAFRHKRAILSDSSFTDDLETDSDDDVDNDFSISSDDTSLSLLKNRVKRETDSSSFDTFEEENDEIFDDVVDNDDSDSAGGVVLKAVGKRQQRGHQDKTEEGKTITNSSQSIKTEQPLIDKRYINDSHTTQSLQQIQHKHSDDSSSSNAKNSGPETESDDELSDIPFDPQAGVVLDRVPRDSPDVTAYEEQADPNSGYMEWEAWDPCSVTCGEGRSTRRRVCINPAHCKGGDVEIEVCVLNEKSEC